MLIVRAVHCYLDETLLEYHTSLYLQIKPVFIAGAAITTCPPRHTVPQTIIDSALSLYFSLQDESVFGKKILRYAI